MNNIYVCVLVYGSMYTYMLECVTVSFSVSLLALTFNLQIILWNLYFHLYKFFLTFVICFPYSYILDYDCDSNISCVYYNLRPSFFVLFTAFNLISKLFWWNIDILAFSLFAFTGYLLIYPIIFSSSLSLGLKQVFL